MLRRTFAGLAALAAVPFMLAPVPRAEAAWSGFTQLPNTLLVSDPSCAVESRGVALCAAIGPGSDLMYSRWNGTAWSAWTELTTVVTSTPSCTNAGSGKVVCAARDAALQLVAFRDSGGTISSVVSVAVPALGSGPSCAASSGGGVLCAGRGAKGDLVAATYNGATSWSGADWTVLAAQPQSVYSPVGCVAGGNAAGAVVCAWIGEGSAISADMYSAGAWQGALDLGGAATNPPACVAAACFVTGEDSSLYFNPYSGSGWGLSSWGGWSNFGGLVHGYSCADYAVVNQPVGLDCGVTGLIDSGFWTNVYNGTSWGGWVQQGTGTYIGDPSCFELDSVVSPAGRAMCVVVQRNGRAASITGP